MQGEEYTGPPLDGHTRVAQVEVVLVHDASAHWCPRYGTRWLRHLTVVDDVLETKSFVCTRCKTELVLVAS